MEKDIREENNIEIRKTFSNIIKEEAPEMTQEETIMKYQEPNTIKNKKNSTGNNSDETTEEEEHLNRIKKELLASLERVKQLAKRIYGENTKTKLEVKVKSSKAGGTQKKMDSQEIEIKKEDKAKERE